MAEISINAQSSIRIDCGSIIWADPFRVQKETHDADIILITHEHFDHFSPEDIARVRKADTCFAAPLSMKDKLAEAGITDAVMFTPGMSAVMCGITIEAVHAYNKLKPFHPSKNNWVGYIINTDKRIYIAGDTDATDEAASVSCDIALIPVGGTYTMDTRQAAELINTIKPQTAIPTHYGDVVGSPDDGDKFRKLVNSSINVEIKL